MQDQNSELDKISGGHSRVNERVPTPQDSGKIEGEERK